MNKSLCIYGNRGRELFHILERFLFFIRGNNQILAAILLNTWDKLKFLKTVWSERAFTSPVGIVLLLNQKLLRLYTMGTLL